MASKVTEAIRNGVLQSDIIILTLGLTEAWQHEATGKYLSRPPGTGFGGPAGNCVFRRTTFLENYENLRAMIDIIFSLHKEASIIISVSPVRLHTTYTDSDIGSANLESKSILLAVAKQVCREYGDNVTYFPSYEMAMLGVGSFTGTGKVFQEDAIHVRPEFAEKVIATFRQMFSSVRRQIIETDAGVI